MLGGVMSFFKVASRLGGGALFVVSIRCAEGVRCAAGDAGIVPVLAVPRQARHSYAQAEVLYAGHLGMCATHGELCASVKLRSKRCGRAPRCLIFRSYGYQAKVTHDPTQRRGEVPMIQKTTLRICRSTAVMAGEESVPAPGAGWAASAFGLAALALSCVGEISPDPSQGELRDPAVASRASEAEASPLARRVAADSAFGDMLRGGRIYDKFYTENAATGFSPDDAATARAADGEGGPMGNGTLFDGEGVVLDNALDHAYRLKNFYGWDMRGAEGIYGPEYQDKAYVAPYNLLEDELSREEMARLFVDGAAGVPAYGDVMPEEDLSDLVAFVMAVRAHELPQPSDIWELDPDAPKGYVLKSGGRAASGHATISSSCSACHGADGTGLLFDDGEFSLGSLARGSAYEVWFKIVAGNPGTAMGSQIASADPWPAQSQMVLDVLAALCDRGEYPLGAASEPDVGAADARCGQYLR